MYRFSSVTAMENSSCYFLGDGTEATFIYKHCFSLVSAMENSFGMSFSGVIPKKHGKRGKGHPEIPW